MNKREDECSFCWELKHNESAIRDQPYKILFETKYFRVKFSLFPVAPNHLLIFPKRHFEKATDMTQKEQNDFFSAKKRVEEYYRSIGVNAWNEGANYGKAAGQSLGHFHYHYFDRKEGDVENPRGGIRNFKPPIEDLGKYKDELGKIVNKVV